MNDTTTKVGLVIGGAKIRMVDENSSDVGLQPSTFGRIRDQVFGYELTENEIVKGEKAFCDHLISEGYREVG